MIIFVADMFAEQYKGGAELTTQAIIDSSFYPCNKVNSQRLNIRVMEEYKDHFWIFGNCAQMSEECVLYAAKNLSYSILEYDYKYCDFRSPGKHKMLSGECNCHNSNKGKLISIFFNNAKSLWWMSHEQANVYKNLFPFLNKKENKVLSSVFSEETLELINSLDTSNKDDKWIILNSPSWIKGVEDAVEYAKKNKLKYELVWDISHKELLNKLAESKGIIFFPRAGDTCPRMTIEARLLDCDMILNDNVQHRHEEWFSNKELALEYLHQRTNVFWQNIEKIASKQLGTPEINSFEGNSKYKFIVPFYNCESWIKKCIKSIKNQNYKNFECVLIDDLSTDSSVDVVEKEIANDNRFNLIQNKEKKYALGNIVNAIDKFDCKDEDVIILLDGDDWLASSKTLDRLNKSYNEDCLLTYGSYVYNPGGEKGVEPSEYPKEVIDSNSFRKDKWRASHLRTFKYKLWKNLDKNDLKDGEEYYEMTYDQAIMLPLLEMASERSKYIPEVLHVYNKENPLNVDKIKAQRQVELAQKIRNKKPYTRI